MIPFLIKSTLCLIVSFGIYKFLLENLKAHVFNRFYLVFSLLFSLAIPFISFETKVNLPVNAGIERISNYTENYVFATEIQPVEIKKENISVKQTLPQTEFHWQFVLYALYFLVSLVLLFRFVLNLYRIFRTIRKSEKIDFQHKKLVLVNEKILPYSFFHFIFLNKEEYEGGEIGNQLLAHECTHCRQLHTLDILLVESLKIIFWFNPALWLYRKAIQLNHEFLADESVVKKHELIDYQKLLLKIVFRNNSTYLASNFNYSLIKKRLKMMTKRNTVLALIARKSATIAFLFFLTISITFSKEMKKEANNMINKLTNVLEVPKTEPNENSEKPNNLLSKKEIIDKKRRDLEVVNPLPMKTSVTVLTEAIKPLTLEVKNTFISNQRKNAATQKDTSWIKAGNSVNDYEMFIEKGSGQSGKNAATIKSTKSKVKGFGTFSQIVKANKFLGKRIRFSGYIKTEDVRNRAGFWMRVDQAGSQQPLSFDNMQNRPIKENTDWTKYEIVLDVPNNANIIAFGALLDGTGQIWFDSLKFEIVDETVPTTNMVKINTQKSTEYLDEPTNLDFEKE